MNDNVRPLHPSDNPQSEPPSNYGAGGGSGGDDYGERLARLETRMDYLATKEDVTKIEVGVTQNIEIAVEKMKVWILSGVLGAVVVATSIAVAIIKIFSP